MEFLFLLLLVPIAWLFLLPARIAGTVRRHRIATADILVTFALGGFVLLQLTRPVDRPADYAEGDATLRAMLE